MNATMMKNEQQHNSRGGAIVAERRAKHRNTETPKHRKRICADLRSLLLSLFFLLLFALSRLIAAAVVHPSRSLSLCVSFGARTRYCCACERACVTRQLRAMATTSSASAGAVASHRHTVLHAIPPSDALTRAYSCFIEGRFLASPSSSSGCAVVGGGGSGGSGGGGEMTMSLTLLVIECRSDCLSYGNRWRRLYARAGGAQYLGVVERLGCCGTSPRFASFRIVRLATMCGLLRGAFGLVCRFGATRSSSIVCCFRGCVARWPSATRQPSCTPRCSTL